MTFDSNLISRFEKKVYKTEYCWVWDGSRNLDKYGRFNVNGTLQGAHRFSYQLYIGPIPSGMCVCHTCDNPPCVNPDHLFLGTHRDNMRNMFKKHRDYQYFLVGENHARCVISDLTVHEIQSKLDSSKLSILSLSKMYGIKYTTLLYRLNRMRKDGSWGSMSIITP